MENEANLHNFIAHLSIDKIFSCRPATWNSM